MHKRKGALANSPALFSLKLCIFFAFSCPFLCLFLSFSAFLSLPCPFVILLYPYPPSFCSLLSFFCLISLFTIPQSFISYSFILIRLFSSLSLCIPFYLLFLPCPCSYYLLFISFTLVPVSFFCVFPFISVLFTLIPL